MNNHIYIVINPELGWDNIVGVFQWLSIDELLPHFPAGEYVIIEKHIETDLVEYE